MAGSGEAQADAEVGTLSVPAWRLRWRAPELSLVLSERASALAAGRRDEPERLRAEALAVFALNRLDMGVQAAERAVVALRSAEASNDSELCWRLRIELANCARVAGVPLTGFGVLKPVLLADGVLPELRASALVGLTDCLVLIGRSKELTDALGEADQLYCDDSALDADTKLLFRAVLRVSAARQHRRWGDLKAAVRSAKDGLGLLDQLGDKAADSGYVISRLVLELVCALMDSEQAGDAVAAAQTVLELPVRAPSAAAVGWLKLALATRVHLPAGRPNVANDLLRDVADSSERYQFDSLLSESMLALAHVHELAGQLSEALSCLRTAHTAERRRAGALYTVRAKLAEEFATSHRETTGLQEQLSALIRPTVKGTRRPPETDDATGLLNRRGFRRQIDAVVNGGYIDYALTLVLLDVDRASQNADNQTEIDDQVMRQIADKVRDTVPDKAAVGRFGGDELAVLLPDTTKDQAQQWAEELRSEVTPGLDVTMTTGVAEYRPGSGGEALLTDADRALSDARVSVDAEGAGRLYEGDAVTAGLAGRLDPALRPSLPSSSGDLPRRRARRNDEQAAGLSGAWAQAADRWRMGNVGIPSTPIDMGSTSMFSGSSAPAENKGTSDGLAAFFQASEDQPEAPHDVPKVEPSDGGRRRAEDFNPSSGKQSSSKHANDDSDRPGLASLVELLAAAGTGGRRRAPEPSEPEQTTEAEKPRETSGAGRRRHAEPFERSEVVDELRSDTARWRLEALLSRVRNETPPPNLTGTQSTGDTATVAFVAEDTQPRTIGSDEVTTFLPDHQPMPQTSAEVSGAVPNSIDRNSNRSVVRSVTEQSAVEQPRRPRSELADLLAEALVAFESTQHADHDRFDEDRPGPANCEPESVADRFGWQPEPTGSRHRQPEQDDRIGAPQTAAEPPMLSDWVLSGKEGTPSQPDSSALTNWTPTMFGEERPTSHRDERSAESERNWSQWTWTPPER